MLSPVYLSSKLYDHLSPYFTVVPRWSSRFGSPETGALPITRKMPWDQDEVEIENTNLTREELLEQIKIFSSRKEVMDYAECMAESRNDESLYYLILGIFEMLQESGTHENFQNTIQKHKDQLLTKIF